MKKLSKIALNDQLAKLDMLTNDQASQIRGGDNYPPSLIINNPPPPPTVNYTPPPPDPSYHVSPTTGSYTHKF